MARTFWLLIALACSAFGQSPILDTIKNLKTFPVEEGASDVPPALAALHQNLKHQIRDVVIEIMNRGADVTSELAKAGIVIDDEAGQPSYGQILRVEVEWKPNGLTTWAALKTSLGVMCGEDSSLYLMEREETGWKVRLEIESNLVSSIGNAFGWPQYGFSKAGFEDGFFVVATNINPSCASVWQEQRLQAFTMQASKPAQILKTEMTVCIEGEPELKMEDKGFSLEFLGEQRLSPGDRRKHVLHYVLKGESITRVAPIALTPEDFVDEWRDLPWETAKQWSAGRLQGWHGRLKAASSFDHRTVSCSGKDPYWQVKLFLYDPIRGLDGHDANVFVTVVQKDGAYFVDGISTHAAPGCPSGDSQ